MWESGRALQLPVLSQFMVDTAKVAVQEAWFSVPAARSRASGQMRRCKPETTAELCECLEGLLIRARGGVYCCSMGGVRRAVLS